MTKRHLVRGALLMAAFFAVSARGASAQTIETVGNRALGMGGAFVAVASDSSATWWNPAGLATAPFFDASIAHARVEQRGDLPAARTGTTWVTAALPALGVGYYRFHITDIQPIGSTEGDGGNREEGGAGVPVRSLSASQLGVTVLHTLISGVHVGTTVKYVRGTVRGGLGDPLLPVDELLDAADDLDGGEAENTLDLDAGVLAVFGMVRVGAVVRNLTTPEFETDVDGARVGMRLPRQFRLGAAFHPEPVTGLPLTVALDVDALEYRTGTGDRRVVALGAEQWFLDGRLGVRAGGRVNTAGDRARSATAGASFAPRAGLFVEGHLVLGGSADERGWGVGARVSF